MHLAPFSLPGPKANTLGVRVAAASIDPLGWKSRDGDMKTFTRSMCPLAMGADFAGPLRRWARRMLICCRAMPYMARCP